MPDNNTLYILDSYGLIYRAYYAFINRPLINKDGQNISAVFGFFRNFHRILKDYKPQYILAALDSRTPTFRHQLFDQYKATRQKTPEDLHAQIPVIEEILTALGVPILRCDGYEADDIIATLAAECAKDGRDYLGVLRQRAKEIKLMKSLGIPVLGEQMETQNRRSEPGESGEDETQTNEEA